MNKPFVAINYINCKEHYTERFEELFGNRAKAIDTMPGFQHMQVLKPTQAGDAYLIVSFWDSEENFKAWVGSPQFIEGHKRGFSDITEARQKGEEPPMTSDFKTYNSISN